MPNATKAARRGPNALAVWAGLLTIYLVWGSTYLAIRVAIETIPPLPMTAIRFLVAGAIILGWSVAREGRSFVRPSAREWRDSAIVGAALLGGGMGLVAWAEQTVPSGITALLIALVPAWVALLGRVFFGQRLSPIVIGGIGIGWQGSPSSSGRATRRRPAWPRRASSP